MAPAVAILAARHSRIIENGQKGGMWVELVAETKCDISEVNWQWWRNYFLTPLTVAPCSKKLLKRPVQKKKKKVVRSKALNSRAENESHSGPAISTVKIRYSKTFTQVVLVLVTCNLQWSNFHCKVGYLYFYSCMVFRQAYSLHLCASDSPDSVGALCKLMHEQKKEKKKSWC